MFVGICYINYYCGEGVATKLFEPSPYPFHSVEGTRKIKFDQNINICSVEVKLDHKSYTTYICTLFM